MAFDLDALKAMKAERDNTFINKLKAYIESEKFEDDLQSYLESCIRYENNTNIAIALSMRSTEYTGIMDIAVTSQDGSIKHPIAERVRAEKIGDPKPFRECIENKLTDLRLNYQVDDAEYSYNFVEYINQNRHYRCVFRINLNFD